MSRLNDGAVGGLAGLLTLFVSSVYLPNPVLTNQKGVDGIIVLPVYGLLLWGGPAPIIQQGKLGTY